MKIGLFFGSFNPIHTGHLAIANYMLENTELEKIWFVVSPQNPLKKKEDLFPNELRLKMVEDSIKSTSQFKASDIEFKLPQPSYTINTLKHLKEKFQNNTFSLIIGSDNLEIFHKWKNFEEILTHYDIYIYPRSKPGRRKQHVLQRRPPPHPRVKMTKAPVIEISSTEIRAAIKNKKDVRRFLPEAAWKYMEKMRFYVK